LVGSCFDVEPQSGQTTELPVEPDQMLISSQKMGIVEEEADESLYWMELLIEAEIVKSVELESLMKEADEILAMTVSSIKTARERKSQK